MSHSPTTAVSSFVTVGGVTLHFRRDGAWDQDSGAPLVYLHALGADLRIFDRVVAARPRRRHLRLDLRGHGLSDAQGGAYSVQQLAADLLAVLRANDVQRAVLVGVSLGGLVALRAALDHPAAVAGLVLCDTAAKLLDEDVWNARIDTVNESGVGILADVTLLRWFPEAFRDANQALIDGYRNMISRTSVAGYAGACAALAAEDLRHRLPQLRRSVLVVGGNEDLSTPPPLLRQLADALPDARLELIDGAGHLPMVDAPSAFLTLLDGYLEQLTDA